MRISGWSSDVCSSDLIELAFVEPWLAGLLARRAGDLDIIGVPAQLLAATIIFAIGLFGATLLTARTAMSLKIPAWIGTRPGGWREGTSVRAEPQSRAAAAHPPIESRSQIGRAHV